MSHIKIYAAKELPATFSQYSSFPWFLDTSSPYNRSLGVSVVNSYHGRVWIIFKCEDDPVNLPYNNCDCCECEESNLTEIFRNESKLTSKEIWHYIETEIETLTGKQSCDHNEVRFLNIILAVILHYSITVLTKEYESVLTVLHNRIYKSQLFNTNITFTPFDKIEDPIKHSFTYWKPTPTTPAAIVIPIHTPEHIHDLIRLSGYERDVRFHYSRQWNKAIEGKLDYSYLVYEFTEDRQDTQYSKHGVYKKVSTGKLNTGKQKYIEQVIKSNDIRAINTIPKTAVGYLCAGIRLALKSKNKSVQVISFAIHPSYRRRGHAKNLFNHMILNTNHLPYACMVTADNIEAANFLSKTMKCGKPEVMEIRRSTGVGDSMDKDEYHERDEYYLFTSRTPEMVDRSS